jgi:hypothetical protein
MQKKHNNHRALEVLSSKDVEMLVQRENQVSHAYQKRSSSRMRVSIDRLPQVHAEETSKTHYASHAQYTRDVKTHDRRKDGVRIIQGHTRAMKLHCLSNLE